jgi:uncharacterized protein (TIGR00303 family)
MQTKRSLIDIVSGQGDQFTRAKNILAEIARADAVDFNLALGATAISDIEGASAAGADAEARRQTPKLDAEALVTGRTALGEPLPSSPAGVTSPVVITRACLSLIKHTVNIIDCGTFEPPQVEHATTVGRPGKNIALTDSMDISQARALFDQGWEMALKRNLKQKPNRCGDYNSLFVLAECVPGGTTTALGVLNALGFAADQLLSSSIPGQKAGIQSAIVASGLSRLEQSLGAGELKKLCLKDPLYAVSCLGDPMQAFAAGFTLGALEASAAQNNGPKAVVLAGGSQMLAVYALVKVLAKAQTRTDFRNNNNNNNNNNNLATLVEDRLVVITTKWVAYDPFANTKALAQLVGAPYVAACPDFHMSRNPGLRAYEDGHVKEGTGAGAALLLANLLGRSADKPGQDLSTLESDERTIIDTIDSYYDSMILGSVAKTG